jgi:urease accessory protein
MNVPLAVSTAEAGKSALPARLQRAQGAARIAFKRRGGQTRLEALFQSGASKIRLPNVASGQAPCAVLINSAGGLTGGDRMSLAVRMEAETRALVTTQACEKIYRSTGAEAEIATVFSLGEGARLDWLPQETILFNGARLSRRVDADLAPGATLLILEATIFGRAAHGETINSGLFRDRWRVRRDGRLVFADNPRFDWANAALLSRPAVLAGGAAVATMLLITSEPERHVQPLRQIFAGAGGASAWNGKLLARVTAEGGAALRRILLPALNELMDGAALPRMWLT